MAQTEIGFCGSWEFRTEEHDIKFGIVKKSEEGKETAVVPIHRVSAHQLDEVGILTCELASTCESLFPH